MERLPLVAVVAMARNGVIGREGEMPWRLKSDLKRYRRLTMGKPMIMGRKTLVSIGRVLDGRDSVVLTRGGELPFEGAYRAGKPDEALALAERLAAARGSSEIVVAGGAEIYRLFLDRLTRLHVTHVEAEPEGDAVFPPIDPAVWALIHDEPAEAGPDDSSPTRYSVYERRASLSFM
ncbi:MULTISPECIES: dihydrofolate reductase [unclassified Aureimonas]|uniref:dihydrofolate reductase n=1 Tax=unclassified Aureimonas TaxID=2615206 RepID=UPI000A8C41DC|nr:dihydrofolate reductase [Aureimonas sp. Leaf427]